MELKSSKVKIYRRKMVHVEIRKNTEIVKKLLTTISTADMKINLEKVHLYCYILIR